MPQGQVVSGPADVVRLLTGAATVPDGHLLVGDGDSTLDAVPPYVEQASNFTAENHRSYLATATLTVTDPTPEAGAGFDVLVVNGTCTIGGVGYSPGVQVWSVYYSGAWVRAVIPSLGRANTWSAVQTISDATDSTALGNGSLVTAGGASIAKQLRVGTAITVSSGWSDYNYFAVFSNAESTAGLGVIVGGTVSGTVPNWQNKVVLEVNRVGTTGLIIGTISGDIEFQSSARTSRGRLTEGGVWTFTGAAPSASSAGETRIGGAIVDTYTEYRVAGTKVIGAQGAAVADATGAGDVVAQLNALLARCRAHGLIAT
jgi:hypothetical protein